MIVALLNQRAARPNQAPALHLAGAWTALPIRRLASGQTLTLLEEPRISGSSSSCASCSSLQPKLRGRIKISAFQRGQIIAHMLRDLLAREVPQPIEAP